MDTDIPIPCTVLRGHTSFINSVCFISENILASGSGDGDLKLWDLKTRRVANSKSAHGGSLLSISKVSSSNIATSGRDGLVQIWDTLAPSVLTPVVTLRTDVQHFCSSVTDRLHQGVGVGPSDPLKSRLSYHRRQQTTITYYLLQHFHLTKLRYDYQSPGDEQEQEQEQCVGVETSSSSPLVYVGRESGHIRVFDLRNIRVPVGEVKLCEHPLMALEGSPSGKTGDILAGNSEDRLCKVRHTSLSSSLQVTNTLPLKPPGIGAVKYRCDGRLIVTANWDNTVRVYDNKRLKPLAVLRHHKDSVFSVDFGLPNTSTCGLFASGSKDCTIAIWDLYSDKMK
eukprot:gene2346-4559_t